MNKIKSWIRKQWLNLRFRYLLARMDDEQLLNCLREMEYIVWQSKMNSAKLSPYHRKVSQ
jgi:hypothetical protein